MKLPDATITPVYRSDGSGTTNVFTTYLVAGLRRTGRQDSAPTPRSAGRSARAARATRASRPRSSRSPNSIGYVEYAYAKQNKLPLRADPEQGRQVPGAGRQGLPGRGRQRRLERGSRLRHLADEPDRRRGLADHGRRPSSWSTRTPDKPEQVGRSRSSSSTGPTRTATSSPSDLDYVPLPDNVVSSVQAAWRRTSRTRPASRCLKM